MILKFRESFNKCLLITEFEFFFPTSIYGPNAKQDGYELKCKNLGALTYRKQRENEFSKMFIITCRHRIELERPHEVNRSVL